MVSKSMSSNLDILIQGNKVSVYQDDLMFRNNNQSRTEVNRVYDLYVLESRFQFISHKPTII